VGSFPIKYLGIPHYFNKLRREGLQPLIESLLKRITRRMGRLLSTAAKKGSNPSLFV
jgi:hypothetical protein